MCGIAGIFAYRPNSPVVDQSELLCMREQMINRGPDGEGMWLSSDGLVGLAHRRLAIIDLSTAGLQPLASNDGSLQVVFNGEIYNYKELRSKLERKGYVFRTNGDTEVLLGLYLMYGAAMADHLRGMFSFAIWDGNKKCLLLARDPFGIKPLYYSDDGKTVRFASQVKAIVKGDGIRLTPDPAGQAGFFIFGHVPEPCTLYREIRAVPPGRVMIFSGNHPPKIHVYYDLAEKIQEASFAPANLSDGELQDLVSAELRDSIQSHLVSDVPIGVFLSAGIDSSVIAAHAVSESSSQISTVTVGFNEFRGRHLDEVPLAEAYSRSLDTRHTTRRYNQKEFFEFLPAIWDAMDQPSIDGVNSWLVAKAAAEQGLKVCLSGLGGDELFGGYSGFKQIPKATKIIGGIPLLKSADLLAGGISALMPEWLVSKKFSGLFRYGSSLPGAYLLRRALFLPKELSRFMDPYFLNEGLKELDIESKLARNTSSKVSPHANIVSLELNCYMRSQLLRDTDWASMANGVEVRVPLVDVRFFQSLLPSLVSSKPPTKATLADSSANLLKNDIKRRSKTGFSTPVRQWLSGQYCISNGYRGLRGWSRVVYSQFVPEVQLASANPIPPRITDRKPVLVYRIGQLGDTLVSLPAFQAIREQFPDDEILLLTDRHPDRRDMVTAWDVLEPTKLLSGVMYYPVLKKRAFNVLTYIRLALRIRKFNPKLVINLAARVNKYEIHRDRFFFKTICGIDQYSFLEASGSIHSINGKLEPKLPEWLRILNVVSPHEKSWNYRVSLPRWAQFEALAHYSQVARSGFEFIGVGPGSKMPAKRWSIDKFEVLGNRLLDLNPKAVLLVFGGAEDREFGDFLVAKWGERAINVAGKVSIFGSAALLSKCKFYVGNDTGTMHLAALVGTPCIAIFSARDVPGKWEPIGNRNHVIRKDVSCAGCMLEVCKVNNNKCLNDITVEDVMGVIA